MTEIYQIDASKQSLGRLASRIALVLRGKNSPLFTANQLPNVSVVVSNIDKIEFLGTKLRSKKYHRYSGYPGGLHSSTLDKLWHKNPRDLLRRCVYGMLPENRLRAKLMKNISFK